MSIPRRSSSSSSRVFRFCLALGLTTQSLLGCAAEPMGEGNQAEQENLEVQEIEDLSAGLSASDRRLFRQIVEIEDQRLRGDARLKALFASRTYQIRARAVRAVGQMIDNAFVSQTIAALRDSSAAVRKEAAEALSVLQSDVAKPALVAALAIERNDGVRAYLLGAIAEQMKNDEIPAGIAICETELARAPRSSRAFQYAAYGLNTLLMYSADATNLNALQPSTVSTLLETVETSSGEAAEFAALALARAAERTAMAEAEAGLFTRIVAQARAHSSMSIRARLGKAIAAQARSEEAAIALAQNDPKWQVRVPVLESFVTMTPAVKQLLIASAGDSDAHIAAAALRAIGNNAADFSADEDFRVLSDAVTQSNASPWVLAELLNTALKLQPQRLRPLAIQELRRPDAVIVEQALIALRTAATIEELPTYRSFFNHAVPEVRKAAIVTAASIGWDKLPEDVKSEILSFAASNDYGHANGFISALVLLKSEAMMLALTANYESLKALDPYFIERTLRVVQGAKWQSALPLIDRAMQETFTPTRLRARSAYKAITGTDAPASTVGSHFEDTPSDAEMTRAQRIRIRVQTTRGSYEMRMNPLAPRSAARFVRLVEEGAFAGSYVGSVYDSMLNYIYAPVGVSAAGNPGFSSETSFEYRNRAGEMGMGDCYNDGANASFYNNFVNNYDYGFGFVVFARVTRGMSVYEGLQFGDRIVSVTVVE